MTEPLFKSPTSDPPSERSARRLRTKLSKPVISAPQPGLLRDADDEQFLEPDRSEPEVAAEQPSALDDFEPEPADEGGRADGDNQVDDHDDHKPVTTPPAPPTRPTRRARRSAAKADALTQAAATDAVTQSAVTTDEIEQPSGEVVEAVEALDLTKLPPPSGEPVAYGEEVPLPAADIAAEQFTSTAADVSTQGAHDHAQGAHDGSATDDPALAELTVESDDPEARLVARATTPELGQLELRQIAGLTSGVTLRLDPERYDFSENSEEGIGFQIEVDHNERALVVPGTNPIKVDTVVATTPTLIGAGVLDVGSARFLVRHRREHKRATDWLDQYDSIDRPEPLIEVPAGLGLATDPESSTESSKGRRRRKNKNKKKTADPTSPALNVPSWEFIEKVRATRIELTDRERYLHPDPAELAERAFHRAPILGIRPPGHPLFAKVGVLVADMPWMPRFEDISAVPDSLGPYMKPLMSLPSMPIAADLMVGPLGIVGSRNATVACARHIMVSLYGLSTSDLHLHVVAGDNEIDSWEWAFDIAPERAIEVGPGFPLVVVDGMENFASSGLNHHDAIDKRAGLVILAESVEDLPAYCGTVLQVDRSGGGLLTNHLGHIIAGTPIGVTATFASAVADDLHSVMERRHNR